MHIYNTSLAKHRNQSFLFYLLKSVIISEEEISEDSIHDFLHISLSTFSLEPFLKVSKLKSVNTDLLVNLYKKPFFRT